MILQQLLRKDIKGAIFTNVTKTTVQFDVQPDYQGTSKTLYANLYQPAGDALINRAAIVFIHGGGFTAGTRDGSNISYFCQTFAKKGFVVASIDYRLGIANPASSYWYSDLTLWI